MMMQRHEVKPMADNFKNGGAPDRSRVSMNNLHDVRYWTQTLGCSSDELAAAVARVGNSSDAVRREVYRAWAYGTFPLGAPKTEAPTRRLRGRPRKHRKETRGSCYLEPVLWSGSTRRRSLTGTLAALIPRMPFGSPACRNVIRRPATVSPRSGKRPARLPAGCRLRHQSRLRTWPNRDHRA